MNTEIIRYMVIAIELLFIVYLVYKTIFINFENKNIKRLQTNSIICIWLSGTVIAIDYYLYMLEIEVENNYGINIQKEIIKHLEYFRTFLTFEYILFLVAIFLYFIIIKRSSKKNIITWYFIGVKTLVLAPFLCLVSYYHSGLF